MVNFLKESFIPDLYKYLTEVECDLCHGKRLKADALNVKINGLNIIDLTDLSVVKIKDTELEEKFCVFSALYNRLK